MEVGFHARQAFGGKDSIEDSMVALKGDHAATIVLDRSIAEARRDNQWMLSIGCLLTRQG